MLFINRYTILPQFAEQRSAPFSLAQPIGIPSAFSFRDVNRPRTAFNQMELFRNGAERHGAVLDQGKDLFLILGIFPF